MLLMPSWRDDGAVVWSLLDRLELFKNRTVDRNDIQLVIYYREAHIGLGVVARQS